MKLLADLHISPRTVSFLRELGHDVVRVAEVLSPKSSDEEIVAHAASTERVILTQDLDFSAIIALRGQSGPSLITLRLTSSRVESVNAALKRILPPLEQEARAGVLVSVEDDRIRRRRFHWSDPATPLTRPRSASEDRPFVAPRTIRSHRVEKAVARSIHTSSAVWKSPRSRSPRLGNCPANEGRVGLSAYAGGRSGRRPGRGARQRPAGRGQRVAGSAGRPPSAARHRRPMAIQASSRTRRSSAKVMPVTSL